MTVSYCDDLFLYAMSIVSLLPETNVIFNNTWIKTIFAENTILGFIVIFNEFSLKLLPMHFCLAFWKCTVLEITYPMFIIVDYESLGGARLLWQVRSKFLQLDK